LVVAQGADITTGDPRQGVIGVDYSVYFQMCDALVTYDRNWNIVPQLATSWKIVNPTTYEFALRQGVKFQDGTPLTAADVKATMDRILDPAFKSEVATDFSELIRSTSAPNATTVRFNLKVPYGGFLYQLPYIYPVSQDAVKRLGDQEFARRPICAGPYRMVERVPDDRVVLEAFEGYWGGRPKIDRIIFRPIPQSSTRAAALRAGEVDLIVNIAPDQVAGIKEDPKLLLIERDTGRMEFFLFDQLSKPFDDKRVRQAFNYAVDWDAIIKSIMGAYGRRAPGPAMSYMFGYKAVRGYPYDPTKARQLLADAGYASGLDVVVEAPNGRYFQDKEIAQAVVGYLQQAGVRATLRISEWGQHVQRRRTKQYKVGLWGFVSLYHQFDDIGFHFEPARGANYYNIPAVTAFFEQGRAEVVPAKRAEIYSKLIDMLVDEAVFLYGVSVVGLYGVNRRVNWFPRSGSDILFDLRSAALR
jgi:peptide/nickel transport system substrate-binding protein